MSECLICVRNQALKLGGSFDLKANATLAASIKSRLTAVGSINSNKIQQFSSVKTKLSTIGTITSRANLSQNIIALDPAEANIRAKTKLSGTTKARINSSSSFKNTYTDKFAGHIEVLSAIKDFACVQKLYPIGDQITSLNNSYFVNKYLSSGNLYDSIDEGLFTGNYNENLNQSSRISDDNSSYIQPSSIFTSGTFRYKCNVTRPYHHPKNSFLFIRAAAPLSNYGANIPPEYRIHNIKLEDPSGNTIIQYKEITLKGDANYSDSNILNYATYISEPEINNANLNTWEENYPVLYAQSGYTLNMDFDIICLDDPFDTGFSKGYEERACELKFVDTDNNDYLALDGSPLSTHTQGYHLNPTNTIRISAIEICNSGELCPSCEISGIKNEGYFGFYTEVTSTGQRLSRTIYPTELSLYGTNVNIYPEEYSLWESSPDDESNTAYNITSSGTNVLVSKLRSLSNSDYITLLQSDNSTDSGRLTLKFSHEPPRPYSALRSGAFDLSSSLAFDLATPTTVTPVDNFFEIDSLELKVVAKKATGSPNYVLDIVGYSDDKLLNVTPKIGAFLQNTNEGTGSVPQVSGFKNIDDLGTSSEAISDKAAYYENYLTSIDAGDHYKLSSLPVINSTTFQEYTIPLTIYEDYVDVGRSTDYSMSSYFENLYIDFYPIPSGASISSIRLVINYKPSNGIMLHTLGTQTNKKLEQRDIVLLPIGKNNTNDISINCDIDDGPLSVVSGIPHSYSENATLKTNYSRRWRGVDGNIVNGPYNPNEFNFSFYNPQADHPFLNGLFDFTNISNSIVYPVNHPHLDYSPISGIQSGSENVLRNFGLRFNNTQLFVNPTDYTTLDWTQVGDDLYGRISDSYDSALSINPSNIVSFTPLNYKDGFAVYLRFTPGPDFYQGFSNFIVGSSPSLLAIGTLNNKLSVAINTTDGLKSIADTIDVDEYQYPLSVLLTYSKDDNFVKLYSNNETQNSQFLIGSVSGVVVDLVSQLQLFCTTGNYFVHEFGISNSGNLVDSDPDRLLKQTTASSFLEGHSHTFNNSSLNKFNLHSYIDDDISSWNLGAFKICAFSPSFDGFTKRIGKDYIVHHLKHHGSGYSQITNMALPSSIYASGLAYHTQIENDFLRFNLQDIPSVNPEFYSTLPRICKTLPRDYDFAERAFVVDTILEHETYNNINWADGSVGPKLIVSLYSKNQDPIDRPSKVNWGLINRSIHYLKPSGCYEKLSSTFNYKDLIDISEPWALFDLDNIRSEFDQKYYSKDINDMFLQYDLVYPSGSPIDSKIKIHSTNVRLEDALVHWADASGQINLYASGELVSRSNMDLFTYGSDTVFSSGLVLYTSGSPWSNQSGIMNLYVSGIYGVPSSQFNLFVKNSGEIFELGPDLYVLGGHPRDEQKLPLVMVDNSKDQLNYSTINLFVKNTEPALIANSIPLIAANAYSTLDNSLNQRMSLTTFSNQVLASNSTNSFNLFLHIDEIVNNLDSSLTLFTTNYLSYNQAFGQKSFISWNQNNVGTSIDPIVDSGIPYLNANDEIRGVDLLCFGNCDSSTACVETPITLHDINWYGDYSCVEGGILRAKNTYTNLDTSGFKTNVGYSGNFYGIRKYDGLVPNAPYNVTITTKTGDNTSIILPTKFTELDYGSNEYVDYSGVKFAADKDLISDERQAGNKYGKSVSVKNDLIAIGAPMQTLEYSDGDDTYTLAEAGAVFLYRRDARPSGYSWPENQHKSEWTLETKLTLPSGLLKDYATIVPRSSVGNFIFPETVTERFWNVGQEGRQFGHSVALAINENQKSFEEEKREIIVVGGPSSKWTRNFEELDASGVSIGLIVFTDEFTPTIRIEGQERARGYWDVLDSIQNKDLIFSYFSDPPVKFNVKLIICEPVSENTNTSSLEFLPPAPTFITKQRILRNQSQINSERSLEIFDGIKSAFETAFPYDPSQVNNNIPVMLGVYVDNSRSLGEQALQPALDNFLSYYRQYSFASGVRDFFGVQSSGGVYKFDASQVGSENWVDLSISVFNELLDTGRLIQSNEFRYFTSGVGPQFFNTSLSSFNHPPASGGRAYIFEKESGSWNLIQEIKSPVELYDTIDRFGHAVAISDDTNIVAIGSPYISECCKVYQYNKLEKERLFNGLITWVNYQNSLLGGNSPRYVSLMEDYDQWLDEYGFSYANKILYSKLTSTEKFQARDYLDVEEYNNIFTYSYGNIPYKGEYWTYIAETFAPSSRLGYSVAVNDDGSIVAIGAPTDSLNVFDDLNVYGGDYDGRGYYDPLNVNNLNGSIQPSWRSNVNAGAVRLLESREYYPHNKVVEYGKFGNLQQSLNDPLDSGHFNYLANIFSDKNFVKLSEDNVSIPTEAGLAFIITPGVDAVSDEIIDNIISWLALGDRNLVLVGNDPEWEAGGIYKTSNDIINKILDRVNSRMRIYPARNVEDSLSSSNSVVVPSFRPERGTQSYIQSFEMNTASGVGDIRIHFPGVGDSLSCNEDDPVNEKCALPLVHMGDLRAQWYGHCYSGNPARLVKYPKNWAFKFRTFIPTQCLNEDEAFMDGTLDLPNRDPIPLLAAASTRQLSRTLPAVPASYIYQAITEERTVLSDPIAEFNNSVPQASVFIWDSGVSGYSSYTSNINNISSTSITPWYAPSLFQNRKGILQTSAASAEEVLLGSKIVSNTSQFCVEEVFASNVTSKLIGIAGVETESENALYKSGFNDNNINFYANIVAKTINGEANIAQLGSWTGRSTFKDAYSGSVLTEVFRNTLNPVFENVDQLSPLYDVCWIANPLNLPTQQQINQIKAWLNLGNKKLIITHDNTIDQVLKISRIFELLDSKIKPLYLPVKDRYANASAFSLQPIIINPAHPVGLGFGKYEINQFYYNLDFVPFASNNDITSIAYIPVNVVDDQLINATYMRLNSGVDKVTFPAIAGSGYKIFVSYVNENLLESIPIDLYFSNIVRQPKLPFPDQQNQVFNVEIKETVNDDPFGISNVGYYQQLNSSIANQINTISFNGQVVAGKNEIEVYINALRPRILNSEFIPKTVRLLGISGVPIPINSLPPQQTVYQAVIGFNKVLLSEAVPEQTITQTVYGAIQSYNDRYCSDPSCSDYGWDGQLIEDGPVVAAQEIEFITDGIAGVERSRITVIADSNLVQGRYMADEFGRMSAATVSFIRSLYPPTEFPTNVSGRQYNNVTKIVAPERGSPQKYYALRGNSGSHINFGSRTLSENLFAFSDKESSYDPNYVIRPEEEFWGSIQNEKIIKELKSMIIDEFIQNEINQFGATPMFSGVIDGNTYIDIGISGGIPKLMKDKGYDYLDIDQAPSGFLGDLFGYSVALHKNKLVVGSPFTAFSDENINNWLYYNNTNSGIQLSYNGGAGAAYIYEKTFNGSGVRNTKTPWEFIQKLRPNNINAGQDISNSGLSQSYNLLGPNSYTENNLINFTKITDQFGYDVSIDSDVIAVGAPGHDFGKNVNTVYNSGSFIRKAFNEEFDIPIRTIVDLGNSGVRTNMGSGIAVLNNGAIFTFENKISDWTTRTQKWQFVEKALQQGSNTREQSSNTNDLFGRSVAIHRSNRSDSDYVLVGGSEKHSYSSSGESPLSSAGAAYSYDIMLRSSSPAKPNPNSYIDVKVFGERSLQNEPTLQIITDNSESNKYYKTSGIIYTNREGAIFMEASGQDPSVNGFIQHRPFVFSIDGLYYYGIENTENMQLFVDGNIEKSENMNLYIAATTGNVYNILELYTNSVVDFGSGVLNIYTDCPDPTQIFDSGLPLYVSGIGISTDQLNMRVRGF
jgi:hypothetical protein